MFRLSAILLAAPLVFCASRPDLHKTYRDFQAAACAGDLERALFFSVPENRREVRRLIQHERVCAERVTEVRHRGATAEVRVQVLHQAAASWLFSNTGGTWRVAGRQEHQ